MQQTLSRHLMACAKAFAKARGYKLSTVGKLAAASDSKFFLRLQEDGAFTVHKYDQILIWFSRNWPPNVAWPRGVPRPSRRVAA